MGASPRSGAAPRRRWIRAVALAVAVAVPLALLATGCGGGGDSDDEEDRPVSAPPRVTAEHGQTVVTLDPATLARSGIVVEPLRAATHRAAVAAYGTVLDLTGLAEMRGAFVAAAATLDQGRAALAASRAEFDRLRTLYADDRNASQKALQSAASKAKVDEAAVRAAEGALEAQRALGAQRWGAVIGGWLEHGDARLDALLAQKDRLLEVTVQPGTAPPPAGTPLTVQPGGGGAVEARVVSASPRTDPRIQGATVLATAPAMPEMLPGITVAAQVPVGPAASGVVVPTAALVWWQGRAWVYVETGAGTFARHEVATDAPVPGGLFQSAGLPAGVRVVVRGAQTLLSEEGRGAVHGSEG